MWPFVMGCWAKADNRQLDRLINGAAGSEYGGTSVGSVERIQAVAKRVAAARLDGHVTWWWWSRDGSHH